MQPDEQPTTNQIDNTNDSRNRDHPSPAQLPSSADRHTQPRQEVPRPRLRQVVHSEPVSPIPDRPSPPCGSPIPDQPPGLSLLRGLRSLRDVVSDLLLPRPPACCVQPPASGHSKANGPPPLLDRQRKHHANPSGGLELSPVRDPRSPLAAGRRRS